MYIKINSESGFDMVWYKIRIDLKRLQSAN